MMNGSRPFALAALLALTACHKSAPDETVTETAVAVEVEQAKTGTIREVIAATGIVTAPPGGELVVTAPEAARIVELPKAEGDRVRAGDLLVRFEIPSLTAGAASTRAGIEQASARVENAKAASARVAGLFERGVAARKEVEDAERELRESQAALAQAQSASGAANTLAGRLVVRASFSGVVAKRWHNPGDLVEPGPSDPILRVIDPSHLEVTAAVPVSALARLNVGAPARIIDPAGGEPLDAAVISRPAAVEAGSVTASIRLRPKSAKELTAGMSVQVEIMGPEHTSAVLIPPAALVREGSSTIVMTVGADGKAHRQEVELGVVAPDAIEIRKGIKSGDKVLVRGQNGLPDGAAVTVGS
ncbi:MAG: rane fusion protein multidrug efflux system [Acidobacteriota bacterium]|jgi:RND family efflux transporter MFP subunit